MFYDPWQPQNMTPVCGTSQYIFGYFLASGKRLRARRRLGLAALVGFGLFLTIECLQLLLHVGFFELTDLVMNTLGAFVGAGVSVVISRVLLKQ